MSSEQMTRSGHCKLYFSDRLYLPLQLDDPIGPAFLVAMVTHMRTGTKQTRRG